MIIYDSQLNRPESVSLASLARQRAYIQYDTLIAVPCSASIHYLNKLAWLLLNTIVDGLRSVILFTYVATSLRVHYYWARLTFGGVFESSSDGSIFAFESSTQGQRSMQALCLLYRSGCPLGFDLPH